MNNQQFREHIDIVMSWLEERQRCFQEEHPLEGAQFLGFDQHQGTLLFKRDEEELVFSYVLIGSWSQAKQTFMWGWGNQTVEEERRKDSARLQDLEEMTDLDLFSKPVFVADPDMLREMVAIAAHHLEVKGIYRMNQKDLHVFFGITSSGS